MYLLNLTIGGSMLLVAAGILSAGTQPPHSWDVRPFEITQGLKERNKPLISMQDQDLSQWKVESNGGRSGLSNSREKQLWRDGVGKLTFSKAGKVTLRPPQPIPVNAPFDYAEVWIWGPSRCQPNITMEFIDARNNAFVITMSGGGSKWADHGNWGNALGYAQGNIAFPLKFNGITFNELKTVDDVLYFDAISFFKSEKKEYPDLTKLKLPFPTTSDTILPSCNVKDYINNVSFKDGSYIFSYRGSDAAIDYVYTPETGTLSDLEVIYNHAFKFKPSYDGGIIANVKNVDFKPEAKGIKAALAAADLNSAGLQLITRWQLLKNKQTLGFELTFRIKGKSLIIDAVSKQNDVIAFRAGHTHQTPNAKLIEVPYLDNRWGSHRILCSGGLFVSVMFDWYNSDASGLIDGNYDFGPLLGNRILSADSAIITGGSYYNPKTDGKRNALRDRIFLTASPDFDEVLPNIPNPPSPLGKLTASAIYSTRMYLCEKPDDIDLEIKFWEMMQAYGMDSMFVRLHADTWRTPLSVNNFRWQDASMIMGGDAGMKKLVDALKALGYIIGPYNDYRPMHGFDIHFDTDMLARNYDGVFLESWGRSFLPKFSKQLAIQTQLVPAIQKKFDFNGVYSDELTNTPPWAMVDYDARNPGAAKFSDVYNGIGMILLEERRLFNGPVWSEGTAGYLWAGLADVNYMQSAHPYQPALVNFRLNKLHHLQNDCGYDLEFKITDIDFLLASQIVYGGMGHLWDGDGKVNFGPARNIRDLRSTLKSFFMMRQLQRLYAMVSPENIRYGDNGKLVDTNTAINNGSYKDSQVYVKYANGLEVWVNRGASKDWKVCVDGKEYLLGHNCYAAFMPGKLLEYSSLIDGKRRDYSAGELYVYVDGRNVLTEFPDITAAGAYRMKDETPEFTWLVPVPFTKEETVLLKKIKSARSVTGYDQGGNKINAPVIYKNTAAGVEIKVESQFFKYRIDK